MFPGEVGPVDHLEKEGPIIAGTEFAGGEAPRCGGEVTELGDIEATVEREAQRAIGGKDEIVRFDGPIEIIDRMSTGV